MCVSDQLCFTFVLSYKFSPSCCTRYDKKRTKNLSESFPRYDGYHSRFIAGLLNIRVCTSSLDSRTVKTRVDYLLHHQVLSPQLINLFRANNYTTPSDSEINPIKNVILDAESNLTRLEVEIERTGNTRKLQTRALCSPWTDICI